MHALALLLSVSAAGAFVPNQVLLRTYELEGDGPSRHILKQQVPLNLAYM